MTPFGNDPGKIARYRAFWSREPAVRPMVGFSLVGWFPLSEFAAAKAWGGAEYLIPEMIDPEEFLEDHVRMLREGEAFDDDVIRGACPAQVAVPWLPGMVGARLRILPENVMGEERPVDWVQAAAVRFDRENPWLRRYLEFADALVRRSAGRFPVGHGPEIGPTDLFAILRGHTGSILDLADEPEKSAALLDNLGCIFVQAARELWRRVPTWHGGWFDPQYSLWSPGPIVRMQEDATAVYSPALYCRFVQPVDRWIARQFTNSFIHLHSTSMFLLPAFLEIEEIRCFQINNDALGPPLAKMVPCFRAVQQAGRPLVVRGAFSPDELRLILDTLDSRGLFLNIMVRSLQEAEPLRRIVGM